MGKLIGMPSDEKEVTVEEALKSMWEEKQMLSSVVIIAIKKDGTQMLKTSSCSGPHKAWMLAFFQSWLLRFFQLDQ